MSSVGVIVGRFQVPELHQGHRYLINAVAEKHSTILVAIGCVGGFPTAKDPLSFESRVAMIRRAYPNVLVVPLSDHPSDEAWSQNLDVLIATMFLGQDAVMYGSRDSFLKSYTGKYPKVELPVVPSVSGTLVRDRVSDVDASSRDFRAGVIYAATNRAKAVYPTVDVAVVHSGRREVLLGAKAHDEGRLRFIGGFVDPSDPSLEMAAKREVMEETSMIETDDYRYLGSSPINDWRYRGSGDVVMTSFFAAQYIFGAPRPSDDITRLEWVPYDRVMERLIDDHKPLGEMLLKHLALALAPAAASVTS